MSCRRANQNAFTLVELLVVIAVIAILAGLILPALSSAKLKAHQTICLSNLKQLNLSALMYWQDGGKGYPSDKMGMILWARFQGASPTDTPAIQICPVARYPLPAYFISGEDGVGGVRPVIDVGTAANAWRIPGQPMFISSNDWTGTYAFNEWLNAASGIQKPFTEPRGYFASEAAVRFPTRTPIFADAIYKTVAPDPTDQASTDLFKGKVGTLSGAASMGAVAIGRHGSKPPTSAPRQCKVSDPLPRSWGVNASFYDGHAALLKLPDLWTLTWSRTWDTENRTSARLVKTM